MAKLAVAAPAKINLHLEVLGLRPDGFHELAMLMQSVDLCDLLELEPRADALLSLSCDRADLPVDGSNLIIKAAELLRQRSGFPELGVAMRLHKRIPVGAGLAGGSSDGAAALLGLNALWGLGYPSDALLGFAAELGSDMPFCLQGGAQLCFGRGELLEVPNPAPKQGLGVLLIKHPLSTVRTPWAYARCREQRGDAYLAGEAAFEQQRQALRRSPLLQALAQGTALPPLRNDLQAVVTPELAVVGHGLQLLRGCEHALAVAMSGSGPTLFALFNAQSEAAAAAHGLAPALAAAGFEHWVCATTPSGVSLVP